MEPKIVVVGAGQLGSRYLQGLVPIPAPLNIVVVEPKDEAIATALQRWSEAGGEKSSHTLTTAGDLASLSGHIDLAIISTSSNSRLNVTRSLAERCEVRNWILEKMLSSCPDGLLGFSKLFADCPSVWVNLPRRLMEWHSAIRTVLAGESPFYATIDDTGFGLLTNSIHYLDLVGWLSKSTAIDIDLELGRNGFFASTRAGYVECEGTFRATYSDGTIASVSCSAPMGRDTPSRDLAIEIRGQQGCWSVDESNGLATGPHGKVIEGRLLFQSEITAGLVRSILAGEGCSLPKLTDVLDLHEKILRAIQLRWEESPIFPSKSAPVT